MDSGERTIPQERIWAESYTKARREKIKGNREKGETNVFSFAKRGNTEPF